MAMLTTDELSKAVLGYTKSFEKVKEKYDEIASLEQKWILQNT
jgi:hypothetical protein